MGIARRLRRLVKGYMKSAREQLDELEAELNARRELEEYLQPGGGLGESLSPEVPMRTDVTTELTPEAPRAGQERATSAPALPADLQAHYRLLGIPPSADLRQAQEAYRQLVERADPARFPEGSEERQRAERIRQRIQEAYDAVRQHLDPTSARFDRLEI